MKSIWTCRNINNRARWSMIPRELITGPLHATFRCFSDTKYGAPVQRFNPYDRAPFRALQIGDESENCARDALAYYRAYVAFSRICHSPQNATTISLRPGTVIFLDNFRIFHARTSFKGWRQMCGCYLSRDNFMAKARPLLPEEIRRETKHDEGKISMENVDRYSVVDAVLLLSGYMHATSP
nr:Taurine catabolism dioxygenase TauD TfdA domain containing protein [Haemonchus contortus]